MDGAWLFAASPLAGMAANVLTQVACARFTGLGLLRSIVVGFVAGAGAGLALDLVHGLAAGLALPDVLGVALFNGLLYGILGYCYFHVVNLAVTARRIRILRQISLAPDGLSEAEILGVYSARDMVAKRLGRLLDKGQVTLSGGRYHIMPSTMLRITLLMGALKAFVYGAGKR